MTLQACYCVHLNFEGFQNVSCFSKCLTWSETQTPFCGISRTCLCSPCRLLYLEMCAIWACRYAQVLLHDNEVLLKCKPLFCNMIWWVYFLCLYYFISSHRAETRRSIKPYTVLMFDKTNWNLVKGLIIVWLHTNCLILLIKLPRNLNQCD